MEMINVSSSNVNAIGYDSGTSTLRVRFNDGSEYDYYNVPENIYNDFLSAGSPGTFLHQVIKGQFSYAKL